MTQFARSIVRETITGRSVPLASDDGRAKTERVSRWVLLWLRDRIAHWDERLALDPRLLAAVRLPFIGHMARRRSRDLFDLCAGFVYAQVLAACVSLDLFEQLRQGPRDAATLALLLDVPPARIHPLLQAAVGLRLLRRTRNGRYGLGSLGTAVAATPGLAAMVAHHQLLYADLADPVAFLRDQKSTHNLAAFWPYAASSEAGALPSHDVAAYTSLMGATQAMVAREVLATIDLKPHRHLLDIGGGSGHFLRAAAAAAPHLSLSLFDLPAVVDGAADAGLPSARPIIRRLGGDFRTDPLPRGADLVSLIRILHDHDDETVQGLLNAVHSILPPGGRLLIGEPMAETPSAERVGDVYFPIYLLAMGRGRTRSPRELAAMLARAGFRRIDHPSTSLPVIASVLVATA